MFRILWHPHHRWVAVLDRGCGSRSWKPPKVLFSIKSVLVPRRPPTSWKQEQLQEMVPQLRQLAARADGSRVRLRLVVVSVQQTSNGSLGPIEEKPLFLSTSTQMGRKEGTPPT